MTKTERIDYINIGLMVIAGIAAFVLPFHVFLFSYAVLGPLHYLTEISWLHEKGYFTRHKRDYLVLIVLSLALLVIALSVTAMWEGMQPLISSTSGRTIMNGWGTAVTYIAFASALALAILKEPIRRFFALLFIAATAVFLRSLDSAALLFSVFLPTLLHVFVFTGAFMLYGALKNRSRAGLLAFGVFLLIPIVMYLCNDWGLGLPQNERVLETYKPFAALNVKTIELFHLGEATSYQQLFLSGYGMLVMRFIAYAYTYHYLNWFSKTSIIKWHQVSRGRVALVGVLWIISVALYGWNYKTGFIALFCLSLMHVFLEFPLNHLTFLGIGRELRHRTHDLFAGIPVATETGIAGSAATTDR